MSKYNSLVKKAELYEKLALYGSRRDFLNAVAQVTPTSSNTPEDDKYLQELDMNSPPAPQTVGATITGPYKIDPALQDMLNRVLDGKINPLVGDGVLGPQTNLALQKFKQVFGKPANRANITAEFDKWKRSNSSPPDLSDAAKRQDYLALHPDEASGLKL